MPLSELDIQSKLVAACKEAGGYGYKQSNKFLAGVPDLYLSHYSYGPIFVEVKLLPATSTVVAVTPLQEETMKKMRAAGSKVCILAVREVDGRAYDMFVTGDLEKKRLDATWASIRKEFRKDWPITWLFKTCDIVSRSVQPLGVILSDGAGD
jgi:hypothetical protein